MAIVAINANDVTNYPEDNPARMRAEARAAGYTFPYLYDESQAVARAYRAACTISSCSTRRKLVYRGQFDDSRPATAVRSPARICGRPWMRSWRAIPCRASSNQHGVQYQMEAGQRPGLFLNICRWPGDVSRN